MTDQELLEVAYEDLVYTKSILRDYEDEAADILDETIEKLAARLKK